MNDIYVLINGLSNTMDKLIKMYNSTDSSSIDESLCICMNALTKAIEKLIERINQ